MMGRTSRKRQRRKQFEASITGCVVPKSLIKWSLDKGLVMQGITPKLFHGTGRGLQTSCNIHPPKVIISVPLHIMITFDNVWNCQVIRNMLTSKNCMIQAKDAFILFLLIEKLEGDNSFYYQYINNLPTLYTTPSFITKDEEEIIPTFLVEEVSRQKRMISDIFLRIITALKYADVIIPRLYVSESDVRWAWNVINTRSVFFDTNNLKCKQRIYVSDVNFALLPILDLLNHKDTADIDTNFNVCTKYFEIITNNHYKSGDQVFINYGPHGNRVLLCEYGFMLPENVHSQIPVSKDMMMMYFVANRSKKTMNSITNGLTQLGVNLEMVCIMSDGFDWGFIAAAHVLASTGTDGAFPHDGFHLECCGECCIVSNPSKHILIELIKDHNDTISKMVNYSSPILDCVRTLLRYEVEMMQKLLNKISDECLLDS